MAYVYGLRASDSSDYFYIGSTKHPLAHRLKQHLDNIRLGYNQNKHLVRKVAKIGASNIVIEALEEVPADRQFEREYQLIQEYLARGVKLANVISTPYDFQIAREVQEYEDYEVRLDHIEAIFDAYLNGIERTGYWLHDKLAELIEDLSKHLIEDRLDEFMLLIREVMGRHFDE